jgi:hypothetical protein
MFHKNPGPPALSDDSSRVRTDVSISGRRKGLTFTPTFECAWPRLCVCCGLPFDIDVHPIIGASQRNTTTTVINTSAPFCCGCWRHIQLAETLGKKIDAEYSNLTFHGRWPLLITFFLFLSIGFLAQCRGEFEHVYPPRPHPIGSVAIITLLFCLPAGLYYYLPPVQRRRIARLNEFKTRAESEYAASIAAAMTGACTSIQRPVIIRPHDLFNCTFAFTNGAYALAFKHANDDCLIRE